MLFSILFSIVISTVRCANILVLNPTIGHSHVTFLGNIADVLARDGHNVTVLSINQDSSIKPFGCTEKSIHKVFADIEKGHGNDISKIAIKQTSFWYDDVQVGIKSEDLEIFHNMAENGVEQFIKKDALIQQLRDSKFDLGITEMYDSGSVGLMAVMQVKTVICASAVGDYVTTQRISGLPDFPSFIPNVFLPFTDEMTLRERIISVRESFKASSHIMRSDKLMQKVINNKYPEIGDLVTVAEEKVALILSNTNEFTESPRLKTNMIQYVGGATVYPAKPVDGQLSDVLNKRKYNALFSLGTFVKSCEMPLEMKKEFAAAFTSFNEMTVIWKYEKCPNDTFDTSIYDNIIFTEWVPQKDLLGDSRLSMFVTHGGMNSITEAEFRGVPMLVIPLFGDQLLNAKNAVKRGIAALVDRKFIRKDQLVKQIKEVIQEDSSYRKAAKTISMALEGRAEEYRNAIKRWTKLIIQNGGPLDYLPLQSRKMSFMELYCLDILLLALSLVVVGIIFSFFVIRSLVRIVSRFSKHSQKPKLN